MAFVWFFQQFLKQSVALAAVVLLLAAGASYGQDPGIEINVVEGEGAINNVRAHTAHDPVVEIRDRAGALIAGATVTFQLPATGTGGIFPVTGSSLVMQTDEHGQAAARGLRPNSLSGPFEIRVTASHQGQTASAVINQTNAIPAEAKSTKKYWIIAVVAGAGAAGAFAATHSSKSSTPTTPQPGIVAGSPTFGPPNP